MRSFSLSLFLVSVVPFSYASCPVYGPDFPFATQLANSDVIKNALQDLKKRFDAGFASKNSSFGSVDPSNANGIQIFSLEDSAPLFEYYHDGTILSNSSGVRKVDGESIFRIGSISKLVTVYAMLAALGDGYWHVRAGDVIPELKDRTKWKENEMDYLKWEDVTLGALAGQVAGVTRDLIAPSPQLLGQGQQLGLPPLSPDEVPACVMDPEKGNTCDRKAFFDALDSRQPTYRPNTKPIYSNTAFEILGYAIESLTGKSFNDVFQSTLIDPLKLTGTSYRTPNSTRGVIPFNISVSDWALPFGDSGPAGGVYSSINDLAKMGRSILNSTLLDANTTRAWLKPTGPTSSLTGLVGRPWEIYRAVDIPNRGVIDIYSKGGDVGMYHTFLALVPDFNIGFATAVAGTGQHAWLDGSIVEVLLPALEAAAREQATAAYAGTYTAANGLNSTLVLTTDDKLPGLGVKQWTSNSTDLFVTLKALFGVPVSSETLRMFPTNLEKKSGNGTTEIEWRVSLDMTSPDAHGPFAACGSWFTIDGFDYGNASVDQFVFTLGSDGTAVSVNPRAFKVVLEREKTH